MKVDKKQTIFTTREEYLTNIVTLSQASEILGISDAYLRQLILNGEFESWEYLKSGRVTIFLKESIDLRKNKFKGRQQK